MTKEIVEFIANILVMDSSQLDVLTRLREDLDLDSLTIVNMIGDLEDEYDLSIEENMINEFLTVGDIINYIEENQ